MHACSLALLALTLLSGSLATSVKAQANVTGWHASGQTWIVWDDTAPTPPIYQVFASGVDFLPGGTTAIGTEVGRLLPEDWSGQRLKVAVPGTFYTLPGPGAGSSTLTAQQGVFALTPHASTPLYFAVVKEGDTLVTAGNSVGPIARTLDPVTAHLQATATHATGQTYRVYAHWVDGRADHTSGQSGYPVMGNASMNGCGAVFVITEPISGLPATGVPAVVALHGGGGHFMNMKPGTSNIGLNLQDAWLISPDGTINSAGGPIGSVWLGYWEGFDRFNLPFLYPVPDNALVVDYLTRRLLWQLDWLSANYPIDTTRVSVLGHSAGASGVGLLTRAFPERWAAAHQYNAHLEAGKISAGTGDAAQNLPTTLPGFPGVADVFDETVVLSATERDLPFARYAIGTNDTAGTATWDAQQVTAYHAIDDSRHGRHLFWDDRPHGVATWTGAYFNGSTQLDAANLVEHRVDQSYPGVHEFDENPATPGQQPFMGAGDPPAGGDPYGTFGGYVEWERDTLTDTPSEWACTLFLVALSATPQDNFPGTSATASVAIRRPQSFVPAAGAELHWCLVRVSDQAVLQTGLTYTEADGLVDVPDLELFPDPTRVRLHVRENVAASEVVRIGLPPNPAALLPGVTSGPVIGATWDPVIDHTSFLPGSVLDFLAMSATPSNIPIVYGTLLCGATPFLILTSPPGTPFALPVPSDCNLVGVSLCTQGAGIDGALTIALTNALDITIGTF